MKRIIAIVAVLTAAGAFLAGTASGAPTEPHRTCADITAGKPALFGSGGSDVVTLREVLGAPACSSVVYQYIVTNPDTGATIATATPRSGDGTETNPLVFSASISDADAAHFVEPADGNTYPLVCVYSTTTAGGGPHLFDRAPDAGCVQLSTDPYFSPGSYYR